VSLEGARCQKSEQSELALEARGEAPHGQGSGEAPTAALGDGSSGDDHRLMELVVARANALAPDLNLPNRRMRTRMSGGVGGG